MKPTLVFLLLLSCHIVAAPITWGPARDITADSDVSTRGTLVKAVCKNGNLHPVVNGVTFTGYGNDTISGANASNSTSIGALPVGGGISQAYSTLLAGNDYQTNSGSTITLAIQGLAVGHHYEVQVWANDSDASSGTQTIKSGGALDPSARLIMNTTATAGGRGQFVTGTFTADATSQTLSFKGSGNGMIQAYQVRRITDPLAPVIWERWQETTGDVDVSTVGASVKAYVFGNATPSSPIQGVNFTRFAAQSLDTIAGMTSTTSAYGSTAAPYANLTDNYKTLVGQGRWGSSKYGSLTLNGLTPGQWYAVQVWVNDSRGSTGGRWTRINGSALLSYNPGGPLDNLAYEGGLGHHMIGTFRASAGSQRLDFGSNVSAQINGLQLRAIPAPDPYVHEAKQRNQFTLVGYIDGRMTSSSRFDGIHLAFGSGQFDKARADMESAALWWGAGNAYTFDGFPAVDAVIRWKKYVSTAARNAIRDRMRTINYATPGTSNLLKLAQTMRILGSQEWGEAIFDHPGDDWRPSDPTGRNWMVSKLREESQTGVGEFASNDYGILNALPSLTLSQLATDPEVRAAGAASWAAFLSQMAAVWQPEDNYIGTWSSRSYEDQSGYLGVYGRMLWQALGSGGRDGDAKAMATMAASGYVLPAPILHAARDRTAAYTSRLFGGSAYQQAYVSGNDYILFSASDTRATGSGWCWGYGVRWKGMKNFFWLMGLATDNPSDMAAASNHGKMQLDFDTLQHRDSVVYAFDKSHPAAREPRWAQAQVPGGYLAMVNDAATAGRIYLHYNKVMIAVASDVPFVWDPNAGIHSPRNTPQPGDSEFRVAVGGIGYPQNDPNYAANISATNNRFAMAIETALPSEYPGATPADQLAAFRAALLANSSISHTDVPVGSYQITKARYVNRHGDVLEKESYNDDRSRRGGWINGAAVSYTNWPALENPWMSQLRTGGKQLTVTAGNQRVVLDYNNFTITPSIVPPAAATPEVTTLTPVGIAEADVTLVGELTSTGTSSASVTAYWGTTDGGTTAAAWANSISLGVQQLGPVIAPISGLTPNTSYRVRFAATNASGTVWSPETVTFISAQTPPPARPDGLATTPTIGSVPLTWNAASGATSYIVRRGTVSGTYTTLASGITATNYSDSTAAAGTLYYYVVAAVGPGGTSANSGEVAGSPAAIPAVPSGLTVTQGYIYPELRWSAVPFATSYTVKRATTSGGPFTTVASGLTTPAYNDTTALNLSTYFWVVTATNIAGESANSAEATLTVNVASFINLTAGNWNAVTWIPNPPGQPTPGSTAVVDFQNSSAIASSNNMGTFALNKLRFLNQSVTLSGNALSFSGTAPTLTSGAPNVAHSIANPITLGADTTFDIAANTLTVSGVISGANDLFKTGAGTLNLAGANTYTGHTYLDGGTLRYGATNSGVKTLFFGSSAGDTNASTLDVQANVTALTLTTQTDVTAGENFAIIGAGKTLTIGGALTMGGLNSGAAENSHLTFSGAGALVCNFGTSASVRRGSILDLGALGSASFTGTNLNVGDIDNYTVGNASTLILPANGASTLNVANINLDSATAGGGTSRGESATFLAPDGTGLLTIRGATGGTSRANLLLDKHAGSGTGTSTVTFDTRGHPCDILLTNLEIGRRSGSHASGNGTAFFHFDTGTLDVTNTVPVAFCEGAVSNTATITLEGGTAKFVGGINLASHSGTTSSRHATATLTMDGNAVVTSGPITMAALSGSVTGRNSTATLQLIGGSLTMTGDIQRGVAAGTGTSTSNFSLKGGSVDMAGFSIGTAANPLTTLTFEGGTLKNIGGINGGAALVKSSGDMLALEGNNTYPGSTVIQDGVLSIGSGGNHGTPGAGPITNSGTLVFNRSDAALVVSNSIDGDGDLVIGSAGSDLVNSEVTLSGSLGFTGVTTIHVGKLRIGSPSGASTTSTLATSSGITNHGTLCFRRTNAADLDLAGAIDGSGEVVYEGSGVVNESRYAANNASTYSGGTSISNSRVAISHATGLGTGPVSIASGGQVFVSSAVQIANAFTISGDGWLEGAGRLGAIRLASGSQVTGAVKLESNSRICAGSGSATVSGGISGPYALEIGEDTTAGTLVLAGTNTHNGNTTVSFGTLDLAAAGSLQFTPGANGVCNRVTGTAAANFKGSFVLDLSSASIADGNEWTLVNVATLNETYAATFQIPGFTETANVWTKVDGTKTWTFSETTGVLSLGLTSTASTFASWIAGYPGLADPSSDGDPDRDGIVSLMEYVLGGDPSFASPSILPTANLTPSHLIIGFRRRDESEAETLLTFEYGSMSGAWSTVSIGPDSSGPDAEGVTVSVIENGTSLDNVSVTVPRNSRTKLFGRIKATTRP